MRGPCLFDRHRRLRGPLKRATGPGSYDEWKLELWEERKRKQAAKGNPSPQTGPGTDEGSKSHA